ncbi:MAG: hypothetical protein NTW33_01995 [Methanoregula sp.]|nr:hypothetical protein [Methanoregula sp.]
MHIAEVFRRHLGWCPDRMMAPRFRTHRADNPVSSIPLGKRGYTMQDVIMDYGSTGLSIPLFTIILAGTIAGLFAIMRYSLFERWSSLGILMLCIFILGVAVRMVHQDIKKAIIEFFPDTITIRRPLFRPVIIAKDTITTIEVRKNIHHSHRWLFRGAMVIFFVYVIPSILSSGHSQYVSRMISRVSLSVFMVYYLAVIVFFGLLFYHGYIRSRYTHVIALCTNNKKIVGLFVDDSGRMSELMSKWRVGAV